MAGWLLQANRSGGSFGGVVVSSFQCSAVWSFRLSNEARGCCQVAAVSALPFLSFPGGLVLKMAAAARPGVEELALLEKLLGLPRGNKYGVQGERKVKGARRGRQRPAAREPLLTPLPQRLLTSPPPSRLRGSPHPPVLRWPGSPFPRDGRALCRPQLRVPAPSLFSLSGSP